MSDSTLITLPFDGTEEHPRPVAASHRRMLYRDLWSDMILERFTFAQHNEREFTVTGVLIVDGAYARFNRHLVQVGGSTVGAQVLVARIGFSEGAQNVEFFFAPRNNPGGLIVADLRPNGSAWNPDGVRPSPIRIPDETITGAKLVGRTIGNALLADNAVQSRNLANNAVQTGSIVDRHVTNAKLADNSVNGRTIADRSVTAASMSGRLPAANLPTRSNEAPAILSRNGWQAGISSWRRHFGVGHASINLTPPANWAGLTGATGTDVLVAIVNNPAFTPSATANFTEMQSGSIFSFSSTTGELWFRSSSRSWGGRTDRNVRGVYIISQI
ncbi:MAG: hypothetical protein FWC86_05580 [Coriobacteriia bacterium]|nr:hypothetical protein [Coriobacteriia bacterium]